MPAETVPESPWLSAPLDEVSRIFTAGLAAGETAETVERNISSALAQYVSDHTVWQRLPLVNASPSHLWRAGQLARFRGMVQDMYDPEFYLRSYGIRETTEAGGVRTACGLYRDVASCGAEERLDPELSVSGDRQTLRCVTVPCQTAWVREAESAAAPVWEQEQMERADGAAKRSREDDEVCDMNVDGPSETPADEGDKKFKVDPLMAASNGATDTQATATSTTGVTASVHLPDGDSLACLVKIYDNEHQLCLNDMVEFVGILSLDPTLATTPEGEDAMDADELTAHNPPPSLVPRLHAVAWRKLSHFNPLISSPSGVETLTAEEASATRTHLLTILQTALLGDALAAELLLCHLISSVYIRHDILALGKFSLNLSGTRAGDGLASRIFGLISRLTEKAVLLPLSLSKMNGSTLVPKKDYQRNVLATAELQLSCNTHLVVDETALTQGQLDERGVMNVAALGHLITWQKLEYDFGFHKLAYTTDVPVLVVSEGKSLLPSDCRLQLQPQLSAEQTELQYRGLEDYLTPSLLRQIRRYLTLSRRAEYSVPESAQTLVQQQFVEWRQQAGRQVKPDDLHQLLVLARLLSISRGDRQLTEEVWQHACRIEDERRQREEGQGRVPVAA